MRRVKVAMLAAGEAVRAAPMRHSVTECDTERRAAPRLPKALGATRGRSFALPARAAAGHASCSRPRRDSTSSAEPGARMIGSVYLHFGPRGRRGDAVDGAAPELASEFPTVMVSIEYPQCATSALVVEVDRWRAGDLDLWELDTRVDELAARGDVCLRVVGEPDDSLVEPVMEILTRCQRWVGRRNAASRNSAFDAALALHHRLHDVDKPLVRADYRHSLDVWQWLLRLRPEAGAAVQIAALYHDIERLISEPDERIEHRAVLYDAFKRAHARSGAQMACELLAPVGIAEGMRAQVAYLIASHDRPKRGERDPDLEALEDADGLSFFSLNSDGFLDYHGPDHARPKIEWTLRRMSAAAHARLSGIYLRPDVGRLVGEAAATLPRTDEGLRPR